MAINLRGKMSVGPSLVTDGLVLMLDPANSASFIKNSTMLNMQSWGLGSGGATGYSQNGGTDENERVIGTDPWGKSAIVWECRPNGNGNDDGGWNSAGFSIDNTKLYRFSVWVKRTSTSAGGTFYLGCAHVVRFSDGGTEDNPYWTCEATSGLLKDQWYLAIGHIFPYTCTTNTRHPDSGLWTTTGRVRDLNGCNIGADCKFVSDTATNLHRTYLYYCNDNTTRLQFYDPRVDCVDGTEPTINMLLNQSPVTIYDLSGKGKHHTFYSQTAATNIAPIFSPNPPKFTLDGATGVYYSNAVTNATSCTVTVFTKPSPTESYYLWVAGQDGNYYLSADYGGGYYHGNCGSPTNYVDLVPASYQPTASQWHMLEAKSVNFSTWTYFAWYLYGGSWNLTGDMGTILVYDRNLSADESLRNYDAFKGRFGLA